jgi:tRNA pseudouridine55 synthase
MTKSNQACSGFLLVDKPSGITSSKLVQSIRKTFSLNKIGHTGTLDPLATGLMVLCVGQATKFSQFLLVKDKSYRVSIKLGVATDTFDAEGLVTSEKAVNHVTRELIEASLTNFQGEIEQIPPMYSAIKKNGVPLYKMARRGLKVDLEPRKVRIYEIKMLGFDGKFLDLKVCCSKGTYIRTIAADLGDVLGCGAHVAELRRLSVGTYDEKDMLAFDELVKLENPDGLADHLLPIASAFKDWSEVLIDPRQARLLMNGVKLADRFVLRDSRVGIYESIDGIEKKFIGVGEILGDGVLKPSRMLASV